MGIVLTSPENNVIEQAIRCNFKTTNNEVEYEALIAELTLAKVLGVRVLMVKSDSQLIINQIVGDFQTRDPRMMMYLDLIKELLLIFECVEVEII